MHTFRDRRIADEVNRACIAPCKRPEGRHDACFVIVKDDDRDTVVRARDGAHYRLTYQSMINLAWVDATPMGRAARVAAGLADPPPRRRLTPAQITVATALRAAGINSPSALARYAEQRGVTREDALREIAGRATADRAIREFEP